jgi:hypothetical protein
MVCFPLSFVWLMQMTLLFISFPFITDNTCNVKLINENIYRRNSKEQNDSCLLDRAEYPCLYSVVYVHRCFHKSTPLQFIMSQVHEIHNLELYFIERTYFLNLWLPKFQLHHTAYQLVHGHILTREILTLAHGMIPSRRTQHRAAEFVFHLCVIQDESVTF